VLHQDLLSLVTPIHITNALLIIVKVPHMPGPVLAQHLLPTLALVANPKSFFNLLFPLLSLWRYLVFWLLLMIIERVTSLIFHVLTIFNIITILKAINYIQPIKLPNLLLNHQSPS
jgi:cellulose synthase/poly-beta-1,6-N-acetylglucosamine synthase-like glycosyltransferase